MQDQPITAQKKNSVSDHQARVVSGAYEIGGLVGVGGTLLGGSVGTLIGKLSKKFSTSKGFVWGTLISGTLTSIICLKNFWKDSKNEAASQNADPAANEPKKDTLDDAAYQTLKAKLASDPRNHVDSATKQSQKNSAVLG